MRLSHVWFSDHSVCYLELGELAPGRIRPSGSIGNPSGEVTIFLGYDWCAKGPGYEVTRAGIHMRDAELDKVAKNLVGATIELVSLCKNGLEIEISLSTGYTIASVSLDDEQDWSISVNHVFRMTRTTGSREY
jgi:hypothetical protein